MKAIAIDDEPLALEVIRSLAEKAPFLQLEACFTNAFDGLSYLRKQPVDLLLLDIKMPDISGLDFIAALTEKPMVIFTTAYSEHAVKSYELEAIDYLLKPFSFARFLKACNKAKDIMELRQGNARDAIFLKSGSDQIRVRFEEILYIEAAGNYMTFVLPRERILSRLTMQECIELLPESTFTRIHRSFIVSNSKIEKLERHQVHVGDNKLPLGQAYIDSGSLFSRLQGL